MTSRLGTGISKSFFYGAPRNPVKHAKHKQPYLNVQHVSWRGDWEWSQFQRQQKKCGLLYNSCFMYYSKIDFLKFRFARLECHDYFQ